MKQTISKTLIGFVFVLGIIFILTIKVDALVAPMNNPDDGGGAGAGGSGTTTPSMQVNLTADLDKSTYNPGDQMTVISSTTMTVSDGGGNTNVTVTGNIVDSGNSPTTILYLNTNSGNTLYGSAVFNAPSVAGDYILRVDASVPGANGREALIKMATKDIPFTVTSYSNNGATVVVWSLPSSGVKNDPVDVGSKTTIHWLASGLGQGASCSSPQNPNVTLDYPSGSFDTGVINSATNYTIACKDKDGNTTTTNKTITPATQFSVRHGAESVTIGGLNWREYIINNQNNLAKICPSWYDSLVSSQNPGDDSNGTSMECVVDPRYGDITKLSQMGTIIFGNNNPSIESLKGYSQEPISIKPGDVPGQKFVVQADGTYKIDFSSNGNLKVKIPNRGNFVSAVNFYLKINNEVFSMAPANSGGDCLPLFSPNSQYSITSVSSCGDLDNYGFSNRTNNSGHTEKTTPYNINFSKTVNLKAGDVVEIKGNILGWGFNSSILRGDWGSGYIQELNLYLDTNATNLNITKEAVTTVGAAPANQISGNTTVAVKGPSMWVYSVPLTGSYKGIINGKIKAGDQTNIRWEAAGLSTGAYCMSPDYVNQSDFTTPEPNAKLIYPNGNFMTEKLPVNKKYTVTCSDATTTTPPTTCTKETKICSDGSSVSRVAPGCDFADCPIARGSTTPSTGGSSCFISDTKVILADNTTKNIQDVRLGDVLKGEKTNNTVIGFHQPKLGEKKLYSFNSGKFFVTAEHPFMTKGGWKSINPELTVTENIGIKVSQLKVGDTLITDKGNVLLKTIDSKSGASDTQLYNFLLNGDHTYYADGYLVHNKEVDCSTGTCGTSGPAASDTGSNGTGGGASGGGYSCYSTYTMGFPQYNCSVGDIVNG